MDRLAAKSAGCRARAHRRRQTAERLSLPITLLMLLLAFGALVAACVPVVLAFSAVLAALGLSTLASHLFVEADATRSVILLIGIAVGVDYSRFCLRREREERSRASDPQRALLRAAATPGQAVLVSGATVLIAMAGMLFAGNAIFTSIGVVSVLGPASLKPHPHLDRSASLRPRRRKNGGKGVA